MIFHHQTDFCKFEVNIQKLCLQQHICSNGAYIEKIRNSPDLVTWEEIFCKECVQDKVCIVGKILVNMFSKFIPNKIIIDDGGTHLINKLAKTQILSKSNHHKTYWSVLRTLYSESMI